MGYGIRFFHNTHFLTLLMMEELFKSLLHEMHTQSITVQIEYFKRMNESSVTTEMKLVLTLVEMIVSLTNKSMLEIL